MRQEYLTLHIKMLLIKCVFCTVMYIIQHFHFLAEAPVYAQFIIMFNITLNTLPHMKRVPHSREVNLSTFFTFIHIIHVLCTDQGR